MFDISIIIPTFNSEKFIKPCLDSIFAQDCQNLEVIVVDNGSKDGTVGFIKKNYQAILLENRQNLGACRARNQGIKVSKGDWVLTLDCDTILEKDFLQKISKIIVDLPSKVGILQPKILKTDKKTIYSCGIYLSWLRRFYDIGKGQLDIGQFYKNTNIFGACAAAAIYNRQMLEDIKENTGYFDERFFFLVEDVDLSWRAKRRGWKAMFYPEAICYHFGNSANYTMKEKQYLCYRNRYYSIIKNDGFIGYFKKIFPVLFYDFPRLFYLCVSNSHIWKRYYNA